MSCRSPVPAARLVDYWLAELPDAEANAIEEHLLGCGGCSSELQWIADLAGGIRRLTHAGVLRMIITPEFLSRLESEGLRVRQYALPAGGGVACTVTDQDDLLVARLSADLAGARRIDLVQCDHEGRELARIEDLPFHAGRGEILVQESIEVARALPSHVMIVKLLSIDDQGEKLLAEYTFNHTAAR